MASNCSKQTSVQCYCYDKRFEDYSDLKAAGFPDGYDYRVCKYVNHGCGKFEVKLRIHMSTKGEMLLWIENFKKLSPVPFVNTKIHACSEDPLPGHSIYKADWKCHLNFKSTDIKSSGPIYCSEKCRSIMHTSLRKARLMTPNESLFDHHEFEGFMGVVSLRHCHNHPSISDLKLQGLNPAEELTIYLIKQSSEQPKSSVLASSSTNKEISRNMSQNKPRTDFHESTQNTKRKRCMPSSAIIPNKALKMVPSTGRKFELLPSQPDGDCQVITQNESPNKSLTDFSSTRSSRKSKDQRESHRMKILYVASSTRDYVDGLFSLGYVPATAFVELREDLKTNYGDNFETIIKDRGFYPNLTSCHQLFSEFKLKKGSLKESAHHTILEQLIEDFNIDAGIESASFDVCDDNYAVAVLSPFMRRISHLWPQAKYEVLLTCCGTLQDDPKNCLFVFLSPSPVGALPVGAFITSSLMPKVISKGVELFYALLDERCFGGNGTDGPRVVLTDDSLLLIRLMNNTFPKSSVFLADKFVVDSSWKWFWGSDSPVPKHSRPRLMIILEDVFHSRNALEMETKLTTFFNDETLKTCEGFDNYRDMLNSKKQHFAISYGTVVDGCTEHTPYESFFSVINDMVMQNSKYSSITTMTHFAMVRLSAHFYRKISDALNGKTGLFKRNYNPRTPKFREVIREMVRKLSKSEFIVKSFSTEGVEYHCNVQLGRCSCYVGWRGCPCKHLGAVAEFYPDSTADNYQPTLSQQDMVSFYNCLMDPKVSEASTLTALQEQDPANSLTFQPVSHKGKAKDILTAGLSVLEEKEIQILPN